MLKKSQILPVGCVVTVLFKADQGKETFALIVGHLTLHNAFQCHHDYVCIYLPEGWERGTFYINHDDICRVCTNTGEYIGLHEKWIEKKYGDYMAYYANCNSEHRLTIDEMRRQKIMVDERMKYVKKYHTVFRLGLFFVAVLSVGAAWWHAESMLPAPIALFSFLSGFLLKR